MLLLTCEHGGQRVPARYRARFADAHRVLDSHRGHDFGALELARELAQRLRAPLHAVTTTRLLVDANRSADNPRVFSAWTRRLDESERRRILREHYWPHRRRVERAVASLARRGLVLHVAVHSFTPVLDGVVRAADIGLLFDPRRARERELCVAWRAELLARDPTLCVRFNSPYRGWTDGLATTLRTRFPARRYAGIELEINQRFPLGAARAWRRLRATLAEALSCVQRERGAPKS